MRRSHWILAVGLMAAFAGDALAADAPSDPNAPTGQTAPPVEPGSVKGLEPVQPPTNATDIQPTYLERGATTARAFSGVPEYMTPIYEPQARYLIPWTGQFYRSGRAWTVFAAETITYDSNIFLSDHDEEDDWISNTSVGVTVRHQSGGFTGLATATLTYSHYFEHDEEDFLGGSLFFDVGSYCGCGWYWGASDRLIYTDDPLIVRDDQFVVIDQERQDYLLNDFDTRVGYHTPKWNAELRYNLETYYGLNDTNEEYNYWAHGLTARYDYYLSDKFSLGGFVGAQYFDYTNNDLWDDPWIYSAGLTFTWRPLAKLGFAGSVGYTWVDGEETDENVFSDIQVVWDATSHTTFMAGWSHSYQPTFGSEAELVDFFYVRGTHSIAPCWILSGLAGVQIGDVIDPTLNGTKDYEIYFFDAMIHRNVGCHWGLDFGYQFRSQRADQNGIDYDDHRVTVGASFVL